jgi:hypothetical protein
LLKVAVASQYPRVSWTRCHRWRNVDHRWATAFSIGGRGASSHIKVS